MLNFSSSGTTYGSSASANQVKVEAMIPGSTGDYGTWFDCSSQGSGIYYPSNGSTIPTNWGISFPSGVNTLVPGVIILKISADASWTGSISQITVTPVQG